jgi:hypothetical protein
MEDPRIAAGRLLEGRGQRDAAGILSSCRVSVRHIDPPADLLRHDHPVADVLIAAPHDLASCVLEGRQPQSNWGQQIEQALRDSARGRYDVRIVQWVEHDPDAGPGRHAADHRGRPR